MIKKYHKSNKILMNFIKNLCNIKMIPRKKLSNIMLHLAVLRKEWRHSMYSKNMKESFVIVVDLILPLISCFARRKLQLELAIPNLDR